MHLDSYLLSVVIAVLSNFSKRFADLFDRLFFRNALDKSIGLHLDPRSTTIVYQLDVRFCKVDILLQFLRVVLVELCVGSVAQQRYWRIGETVLDFFPLTLR